MKKNKIQFFTYKKKESSKKIKINFLEKDFCCDEYIKLIMEKAKNSRVLVISNSVRRAQLLWKNLQEEVVKQSSDINVGLLHSRLVQFKRDKEETIWIDKYGKDLQKQKVNCILVGSQVLEQSLDIDSCCLFTDLCLGDIFIQRLGRLWRFDTEEFNLIPRFHLIPEVYIFIPGKIKAKTWKQKIKEFEWDGIVPLVYNDYYLLKTYYAIKNRKYITPSVDIRKLLSRIYESRKNEPKWFNKFYEKMKEDKRTEKQSAIQQLCKSIGIIDDDDVQLMNDDGEKKEKEKIMPSTRYIKQATSKFVLLEDIEEKELGTHFVLHFLNGEVVDINEKDFCKDVNISDSNRKRREIWKKSLKNSVPIALNRFKEGYEIKKRFKESYKNTILDKFFGKFLFLLLLDENRNLLDINKKSTKCYFIYSEDLGLYKNTTEME